MFEYFCELYIIGNLMKRQPRGHYIYDAAKPTDYVERRSVL